MLKRSVCFVVLALLFVMHSFALADYYSWNSAVSIHCDVCRQTRAFSSLNTQEIVRSISYKDSSYHTIVVSRTFECNGCLARGYAPETYIEFQEVLENHIISNDIDAGHISGTLRHKRIQTCTKCGSFAVTYDCPGSSCIVYMKAPIELFTE